MGKALAGRNGSGVLWTPLPWLGGIVVAYLGVPLLAFLVRLTSTPAGKLSVPGVGAAVLVSVETATVATVCIALTGIPLGYLLARGRRRSSQVLALVVQLPIALPPLMSGILLLYLVGPYTALGRLFGGALTDDFAGIVLAQVFVAAPFCIVASRSAFAALDPALEEVAATLGHARLARFTRVALPAALPGVFGGLLLSWLRAFGEFGATVVLAYHPYSLPVFTYVQFGSTGLPATVVPVAASLGAAAAVLALTAALPRLRRVRPVRLPAAGPGLPSRARAGELRFDVAGRLGGFRVAVAYPGGGARLAVLGESGAGKSLTLRLLAGLAAGERAEVAVDGRSLAGLPPERRGIGYLPQESSLLPGWPVWRQVTFGARAEPELAAYWVRRLGLAELADRRPGQLSGGQRRRVALARALASAPELLLLDEPLTGLDTPARAALRGELRRMQLDTGLPTVVVTHDIEDAALLADDLLVLDHGLPAQLGPLPEVLARPASPRVARLVGFANVLTGTVAAQGLLRVGSVLLEAETGGAAPGTQVGWGVAESAVAVSPAGAGGVPGLVCDVVERGAYRQVEVELGAGARLVGHSAGPLAVGSACSVDVVPERVSVWGPAARAEPVG